MLRFRIDVLPALKERGYNTSRLRQEKILAEGTIQRLRSGSMDLSLKTVCTLCELLDLQPADLLEYIKED